MAEVERLGNSVHLQRCGDTTVVLFQIILGTRLVRKEARCKDSGIGAAAEQMAMAVVYHGSSRGEPAHRPDRPMADVSSRVWGRRLKADDMTFNRIQIQFFIEEKGWITYLC